jgi:hypothetical protein
VSRSERIYRTLLVMYPKQFRSEYGESMTEIVRSRLRDDGGGFRSLLVWSSIAGDLAKSAVAERTETTMNTLKSGWWRIAAAFIAILLAAAGVSSFFEPAAGHWAKHVFGNAALLCGPALVVTGLIVRPRRTRPGDLMILLGVLPATAALVLFWYPPALILGILAAAVCIAALTDWEAHGRTNPTKVTPTP